MELRQLEQFAAVAEELHFGRAAERLGMTQPPLSQAIQRLEAELGVRLFERTHRSVELTPVGTALLPHVREVLSAAGKLPRLAEELFRGLRGQLRIAFVSTADYGVLPELLGGFSASYPEVAVSLLEATGDRQIEALIAEEIDAGIIIGRERISLPESFEYLPLHDEPLMLAVPASFEAGQGSDELELEAVARLPLLIFPRRVAPGLHDAVTGCLTGRGLAINFGQEAIQMQTIVSLVSAGLGFAIVPESLRKLQRSGVRYLRIAGGTPSIETGLIWRRENALPTLRNFVRLARQRAE